MMKIKPELVSPVIGDPIITSPYGMRVLNGAQQFHDGIDFVAVNTNVTNRLNPIGTDVIAIADGIVVFDYDKYDDQFRFDVNGHKMDSAGNMVIIQHTLGGQVYFCRYLHLVDNVVSNNQKVTKGFRIGRYADVGFSYGAHLHFDMFTSDWKQKVDPTPLLFV